MSVVRFGVGDGIVFEPSIIAQECPAQWTQGKIDLGELARLRRLGWTSKRLQAHLGFGRSKINLELRRLRSFARKSGRPARGSNPSRTVIIRTCGNT